MIVTDNLTGEVFEVIESEIEDIITNVMPQPPTIDERIEALEIALLEVILNG